MTQQQVGHPAGGGGIPTRYFPGVVDTGIGRRMEEAAEADTAPVGGVAQRGTCSDHGHGSGQCLLIGPALVSEAEGVGIVECVTVVQPQLTGGVEHAGTAA